MRAGVSACKMREFSRPPTIDKADPAITMMGKLEGENCVRKNASRAALLATRCASIRHDTSMARRTTDRRERSPLTAPEITPPEHAPLQGRNGQGD